MEQLSARLGRADVWALCERRCKRYLMGDSTSMRAETAGEIFEGVAYLMELGMAAGAQGDASDLYRAGEIENDRLLAAAKRLCEALCARAPRATNRAFCDTLKGLKKAMTRYNPQFFAHDPACLVDYPLALPVADGRGARYLHEYLSRLTIETDFLDRFDPKGISLALEAKGALDYELPVNLFEPVFDAALFRALTGAAPGRLMMTKAVRERALRAVTDDDALSRALRLLPGDAREEAYARACAAHLLPVWRASAT